MKMLEQSILMILRLLFNIRTIWMIFIKIWKNTTNNVFDDMIADMLNNIKHNPIVTELFIY